MQDDIYRTSSLPLASFLNAKTDIIEFIGVDKKNPETISFKFSPLDEAEKLADEYFSNKAMVSPLELFKNYRALKDLIFETKRNLRSKKE